MYQFILFFHVLVAAAIVGLVLLQQGKGATAGAAFGSGASQTMFGSRGSGSFLFRVTLGFVALFFITSIVLNNLAVRATKEQRVLTAPVMPVQEAPVQTAPAEKTTNSPADSIPSR